MALISSYPKTIDPFKVGNHNGLNFAYGIGSIRNDNIITDVTNGLLALTDNTTNYIEISTEGVISANIVGFTSGKFPLYISTTSSGEIISTIDKRCFLSANTNGGSSIAIPSCRVYHNATQDCPNNANTILSFNSERFDNDSIHDITTNNTRLTCKTAGKYHIFGHIIGTAGTNDFVYLIILLNGTIEIAASKVPANLIYGVATGIDTIWDMSVNDYIELKIYQNSDVTITISASSSTVCNACEFGMVKVG